MDAKKKKTRKKSKLQVTKELLQHVRFICGDLVLSAAALDAIRDTDPKCKKIIDEFAEGFGKTLAQVQKDVSNSLMRKFAQKA
jgi:hypothetical protein